MWRKENPPKTFPLLPPSGPLQKTKKIPPQKNTQKKPNQKTTQTTKKNLSNEENFIEWQGNETREPNEVDLWLKEWQTGPGG